MASVFIAFISCGDSDGVDDSRPFLTLREVPSSFGSAGGSARLSFSTNVAWRIEPLLPAGERCEWLDVDPVSGDAGDGIEATVRVAPNPERKSRSVTIVLWASPLGERIEIVQAGDGTIVVGDDHLELGSEQQTFTVAVVPDAVYAVTLREGEGWIDAVSRPGSVSGGGEKDWSFRFKVSANRDAQPRTGVIVFTAKRTGASDELTVVQAGSDDPDPERTVLKELYDAGGGGGWRRSDNWCSDRPLGEWYGVETDAEGRVIALRLPDNNLSGAVLKHVGALTSLKHLDLSRNALEEDLTYQSYITNEICSELDNLPELETLDMSRNRLTTGLPSTWDSMEKLRFVDLSSNRLTGTPIPIQWEPLYRNGRYIDVILNDNYFSGDINDFVLEHPHWSRIALQFIRQKAMSFGDHSSGGLIYEDVILPDFTYTDLRDGSQGSMRGLYTANKLTMLLQWNPTDDASNRFMETVVKRFHTLYGPQGFAVVAITPEGAEFREAAERYLQTHEVAWPVVTEYADAEGKRVILPEEPYPSFFMVDQNGEVVEDICSEMWIGNPLGLEEISKALADPVNRPFDVIDRINRMMNDTFGYSTYRSTDFSMDKQYETLQRSTKGKGIDIVLIGEAFTDIDIATGFYREVMEFAMESFFSLEPLKSYREYFNVHMVYAVSRDSHIGFREDDIETALGVYRDESTIWFEAYRATLKLSEYYDLPVASGARVPTVGVVINNFIGGLTYINSGRSSPSYAFTAYIYGDQRRTRGTFIHETAGHGFGLLGDEYVPLFSRPEDEPYSAWITEADKQALIETQNMGWCLNVSLSNDPNEVPWSHLIGHPRFPYVGIFEGGHYYERGVWRSEFQSVMRESISIPYFNATSRELIVKRIMELSGETYTFEKFLTKDSDAGRPGKDAKKTWQRYNNKYEYNHQPPIWGE